MLSLKNKSGFIPTSLKHSRTSPTIYHLPSTNYQPAFTIVELLVVIVVIGILAAITIVSYTGISQKATVASLISDLNNASKLLKMDQVINSSYPSDLTNANSGKGIKFSSDTTYKYVVSNSIAPQAFCLTATKNETSYKITENTQTSSGDCSRYGLVLSLDVDNSSSYPGSGTTWTDLSDSEISCTTSNTPSFIPGSPSYFTFNGTTNIYVCPELDTLNNQNPSVEVWIKTNSLSQNGFWFEKGQVNTQYSLFQSGSSIYWRQNTSPYSNLSVVTASYINTSSWFQIVGTYTSGSRKIYVNGVLANSDTKTGVISSNTNGESIGVYGGYNGSRGYYYNGGIGLVNIYSRELPASEVLEKFNSTKGRYGL